MKLKAITKITCGVCKLEIALKEVPMVYQYGSAVVIHHRACSPIPKKLVDIKNETLASVAAAFSVKPSDLLSKGRSWRVAEARHCLCHALSVGGVPTVEIARFIGRNRSTARHAVRMHFRLAETCAKYREKAGRVSF